MERRLRRRKGTFLAKARTRMRERVHVERQPLVQPRLKLRLLRVEFVRKETRPQKQGILRHSPPSSSEKAEKYRQEVDKKATDFCGGKYQITKEYEAKDESNTSTGVGTGFSVGTGAVMIGSSSANREMYKFIEFICE